MKISGFLSLVLLGFASIASAQTPAPPKADAKKIDTLVKQLGSSRYVEREDAQKELEAIGADALDALRKAAKDGDPEISRRAADMIGRLEEKLMTDKLLAPKMVKLSLKDVSVKDAVDELKKQSGYEVKLEGDPNEHANRKITLETGEVTFFEALDKICSKAGLTEKWTMTPVQQGPLPPRLNPKPRPIQPNPGLPVVPPQQPLPFNPPADPGNPPPVPKLAPLKPVDPGIQGNPVPDTKVKPIRPVPAPNKPQVQGMDVDKIMKDLADRIQAQQGGVPGAVPAEMVPAMKALEAKLKEANDQINQLAQGINGAPGVQQPFQMPGMPGGFGGGIGGMPGMPGMPAGNGFNGAFQIPMMQAFPMQAFPMQPGMQAPGMAQELTLVEGKSRELPTSYSGAVRVRLLPSDSVAVKPQKGEALFVFEITAEPRLKQFSVQGAPTITRAVDDRKQSLTVAEQPNADINPVPGAPMQFQMQNMFMPNGFANPMNAMGSQSKIQVVRLKLGEKDARKLQELTGSLTIETQLPTGTLASFDNPLKVKNESVKCKDDSMLTLVSLEKVGDGVYRARYALEGGPNNNNGPAGFNGVFGGNGNFRIVGNAQIMINGQQINPGMMNNNPNGNATKTPQLVDAKGNVYAAGNAMPSGMEFNNGAMRHMFGMEFRADAGQGEPARFELTGTRTTTVPVPFSFKDVPMP